MTDLPLTGGCNFGAVRFEVTEPLVRASYCHCKRCQRRTGTAASAQAHPAPGTFRIVAGQEKLRISVTGPRFSATGIGALAATLISTSQRGYRASRTKAAPSRGRYCQPQETMR